MRDSRLPHDGWPTWATWNLVLWSLNEETEYRVVAERLRKLNNRGYQFTATTAKQLGYELYPCGTPDMPVSYMADVRWRKVAEAWNELSGTIARGKRDD